MSVSDPISRKRGSIDKGSQLKAAAVGVITHDEFSRAQAAICELGGYDDFEDWLDARWGLQCGLAMAGLEARLVAVDLSSFLDWCALTGTSADERALDAFASAAPHMARASLGGTSLLL
jgi:hypothetical protein